MASVDDNYGYDHVRVKVKGLILDFNLVVGVLCIIPFLLALSLVHTYIRNCATAYCMRQGVLCLWYFDDRMISEWHGQFLFTDQKLLAFRSIYIGCQLFVRFYFCIS